MCVFMDAHMYALSMVGEERDVVATGVKLAGTAEGWSLSPILSTVLTSGLCVSTVLCCGALLAWLPT